MKEPLTHEPALQARHIPASSTGKTLALIAACICLMAAVASVALLPQKAFAVDAYVSYVGERVEDPGNENFDGSNAATRHKEITVDGLVYNAICAEHEIKVPPLGTALTYEGVVENDDMRRIMYYGYGGPADAGYGMVRTATALSAANGHEATTLSWEMVESVRQLPAPPSDFVVHIWGSGEFQRMCTWTLPTKDPTVGSIEIAKKDADTGEALAGATFTVKAAEDIVDTKGHTHASAGDIVATVTTNEEGKAYVKDLYFGTYIVTETEAPFGYVRSAEEVTAVVSSDENGGALPCVVEASNKRAQIGTQATDAETGTHEGVPAQSVTIIDNVAYSGLIEGREYQLEAQLIDASTGEPYLVNGEPVTASKTFVAASSDGTVDIAITFDGTDLDGKSLVVFEELLLDGKSVAIHADINDAGQTVTYRTPTPATTIAQTGDDLSSYAWIIALAAAFGCALLAASFVIVKRDYRSQCA